MITAFASHSIWYEDRAEAYFDRNELRKDNKVTDETVLFVTELVLLGLFVMDKVLNMIGFGKLYLCRLQSIAELICILANYVFIFFMIDSLTLS